MEFFRYRRRPVVVDTTEINGPPDRRDAFEEGVRIGRTQERARHRGHPLVKLAVVVIAIAGAAVLALAAREGSFSRGGGRPEHRRRRRQRQGQRGGRRRPSWTGGQGRG